MLVKNSRGTRDSKGYRLGQHPAHICELHFNFFTPRIYVIVKNSLSQLLILNPVSICVNFTLIFCLSLYTSTIEFFDSRLIDFYICVEIICYVNPPFVLTNNYIKILKKRHKCIWIATTIHNARVNVP